MPLPHEGKPLGGGGGQASLRGAYIPEWCVDGPSGIRQHSSSTQGTGPASLGICGCDPPPPPPGQKGGGGGQGRCWLAYRRGPTRATFLRHHHATARCDPHVVRSHTPGRPHPPSSYVTDKPVHVLPPGLRLAPRLLEGAHRPPRVRPRANSPFRMNLAATTVCTKDACILCPLLLAGGS